MFIMPFIGDGPLFTKVMNDFFLQSCDSYWWTNVLLISNYFPWYSKDMCGAHISLIANEFQMVIILIPLFGFVYKNYGRRILYALFIIVGVFGSLVPVFYLTIKWEVDAFPGFLSNSFSDMLSKLYFRIPPFLIGIGLAVFQFEYKYVDKLNDGNPPPHKVFMKKITKNTLKFKLGCYIAGPVFFIVPVLLLMYNASCVSDNIMS